MTSTVNVFFLSNVKDYKPSNQQLVMEKAFNMNYKYGESRYVCENVYISYMQSNDKWYKHIYYTYICM